MSAALSVSPSTLCIIHLDWRLRGRVIIQSQVSLESLHWIVYEGREGTSGAASSAEKIANKRAQACFLVRRLFPDTLIQSSLRFSRVDSS
jgi:hypothetical protein